MLRTRRNKMLLPNFCPELKMKKRSHGNNNSSTHACSTQPNPKMETSLMLNQWMLSFISLVLDGNSSLPWFHHHTCMVDGLASLVLFPWLVPPHSLLVNSPTFSVALSVSIPQLLPFPSLPLVLLFQILSPVCKLLSKINMLIQLSEMLLAQTPSMYFWDLVFHGLLLLIMILITMNKLKNIQDTLYQLDLSVLV